MPSRGKYDSSITVAKNYYRSVSGYNDELLLAAAWLYKASSNKYYLNYLGKNDDSMGGTGWAMSEFGWDVKYAGVQTLVANMQFLIQGKAGHNAPVFERYRQKVEYFMCSLIGKGSWNIQKTPGGLISRQRWNNMQFVTSASFLATVYSDYLTSSRGSLKCASGNVAPSQLLSFAKSQVDYLLGDNPRATSIWLVMETIALAEFNTEVLRLFQSRSILNLLPVDKVMPLGIRGKQAVETIFKRGE